MKIKRFLAGLAVVFLAAALNAAAASRDAKANSQHGASQGRNIDWLYYGNNPAGTHFLDYDQINSSNVARLKPVWILHTNVMDRRTNFETQPVEADGTVYISSPHDHVFALNAETGAVKWIYNPRDMPPLAKLAICCGAANRGVALGDGKVFIARLDARLIALDANTGRIVWNTEIDPWRRKWSETAAPLYVDGRVIIGESGGEFMKRGHVDAYDAKTGKRLWRFYTVPGPGEFGHDTWAGDSWKTGGATVWSTPVADPRLGLVYFGTGNPAPDMNGSSRAGNDLFSESIVAVDLRTGKYKWHFQEVHHGLWDYDAVQPPILFGLDRHGQRIPAILQCNKDGYCFILDRRNGHPLFPVREKPVPTTEPAWQHASQTQPVPDIEALIPQRVVSAPQKMKTAAIFTPPEAHPVLIQPGWEAGPEWSPSAYSPLTRYAYIEAGGYQPWFYHADPNVVTDIGSTAFGQQPGVPNYGLFDALDTTTGRIVWRDRTPAKIISGVLVADNVIFYGQGSGRFDAVDARSGKELWHFQSDQPGIGGANGSPAAYVRNGREYVVMAFGGNAHMRASGEPAKKGDAVIAFALPGFGGKTNVVRAHPIPVKTGYIPKSGMIAPAQSPPAGAEVIDIKAANLRYSPSRFTVEPGRKVAVHLTVDQVMPAGFAVKLPSGPIALKGPVKPHHSEYFVFTAPEQPGTYAFFSEVGPEKALGMEGEMVVNK